MVGTVLSLLYDEMVRIWCYRWTAITTAIVLFVAGAAFIVGMPDNYDAWAQIYVPRQTSLSAAAANVSLGAEYGSTYVVQKTLLNDQNLGKVAEQLNPALSRLDPAKRQAAILSLRNKIEVVPDGGDGFTEFHYTATSPVKAYNVVRLLLVQFVSSTQDRAQRDFSQADVFLDSQISIYQRKLNESQQKIAAFHARYGDSAALATDTAEEADAASDVENARATYTAALARDGGGDSPAQGQIAALEDRIAALRLQYTDQYPDVIAARQQLAQLQQRAAQTTRTGGNSAVAAARGQLAAAQARLRRARFRPTLPPQIAAQEADLKRTDDMLRNAYQELLARREAAQMSLAVYGANNSSKFQVTNQPTIPATPSGPNRPLLLLLAVLAAIAGGVGAAYLRGAITGVFVAPRELEEAFQLPVIGTISWEQTWHTGEVVQSSRNVAVIVTFGVILLVATVLVSVSTSPWLQATFHQYSTTLFQGFVK